MEMTLAENIRRFRRERSLTQEQLAEVLGVTAGAVHKWEAKLSVPDLELILEMADFFDSSVDVLLGYEIRDNRLETTVKRMQEYRREKDPEGLAEAEKALKKYPHSFPIVNESAKLYRVFGIESRDKDLLRRAQELIEQALLLLPQNTDPEISEQTLYGAMAEVYLGLDEWEKAVELLKRHNAGGLYSHQIGQTLARCEHAEEAMPFLTEALARILSDLANTIIGYLSVYASRGDYESMRTILQWGTGVFSGLRKENRPNLFDKVDAVLLAVLAASQRKTGREDEARDSLQRAYHLAAFFDAAPSYDESDVRFLSRIEGASAHDDLGATAMEGLENAVRECEDEALTALWESVKEEQGRASTGGMENGSGRA